MSKYVIGITMILSMALNLGLFLELGNAGKIITNLKLENAELIRESDNKVAYLIKYCRGMIEACNKE
jgi:hypothetical protein